MYASDASLERYAYVDTPVDPQTEWVHDTGLVHTAYAARLMERKRWHLRRHRWFRPDIKNILNGEICAFRRAAVAAARQNKNKEAIIYTDNANVYYAIQKGRSNSVNLNILCRNVLFLEITHNVRIHARWCPSASMPADIYTRKETYPGCKYY